LNGLFVTISVKDNWGIWVGVLVWVREVGLKTSPAMQVSKMVQEVDERMTTTLAKVIPMKEGGVPVVGLAGRKAEMMQSLLVVVMYTKPVTSSRLDTVWARKRGC
jgi:hypothetical protein